MRLFQVRKLGIEGNIYFFSSYREAVEYGIRVLGCPFAVEELKIKE